MRGFLIACAVFLLSSPLQGGETGTTEPDIGEIVDVHILPRYKTLSTEATRLAREAKQDCTPQSPGLHDAFHAAFDGWVGVSHLRFGPSEEKERAFALAFWPDPRSKTPKALANLLQSKDPAVHSPDAFSTVSIAARGFYALERLLYDPHFAAAPDSPAYHCALVQAITQDIENNARAILDGWQTGYAGLMSVPDNDTYRTTGEAAKQLFTALSGGLEFSARTRLGRPLGSFEHPRPKRAEAWRSGRSLRHVRLSLQALEELAALLSMQDAQVQKAFRTALERAQQLDDPVFSSVSEPQGRLRVEVLQQNIDAIRTLLNERTGPALGIAAGFNALDGD